MSMKKLLCLALVLCALPAAAQGSWNIVGSSGEIDESSQLQYAFSGGRLEFATNATGTLIARYPIKNTMSFFPEPNWDIFRITYHDLNALGQVTTRLIAVEECSGEEELLCQIQAGDTGTATACTFCLFPPDIDFNTHSYYIEAELERTDPLGEVALVMMSLSH
jgi:hypothetical protein